MLSFLVESDTTSLSWFDFLLTNFNGQDVCSFIGGGFGYFYVSLCVKYIYMYIYVCVCVNVTQTGPDISRP